MAINPLLAFVGRITAATAAYLYGSSKDETAPGAADGTPYEKIRADDIFGFQQALLVEAGIIPSGNADTVLISQYRDALKVILGGAGTYQDDIDYPVSSYAKGSDGYTYKCGIVNGPATSEVDPVGDVTGTWIRWGYTQAGVEAIWDNKLAGYNTNQRHDRYGSGGAAGFSLGDITINSTYNYKSEDIDDGPSGITNWGFVTTYIYNVSSAFATQIATSMDLVEGIMYMRQNQSGVWGAWIQILTAETLATETTVGGAKIATQVQVDAGVDDTAFVTSKKLAAAQVTLKKIVDIGDWDMDTTGVITVAHGLALSKIRRVTAEVRNDAATDQFGDGYSFDGNSVDFYVGGRDSANITLGRRGGGVLDGPDFDSTSYNRGWIVIEYIP